MKFKRTIAALLAAMQLFGMSIAFAEGEAADTAASPEQTVETTETIGTENAEADPNAEVNPNNELRVYVSAEGSDSNDGSFDAPLKSIDKAVIIASQLKSSNKDKTVAVTIRGGEYRMKKSVELTAQSSGTEGAPLVIQGYNGEEVKVLGSTKLTPRKFKQVTDEEILARIPEEARQYIGEYDLKGDLSNITGYSATANAGTSKTNYYDFIVDGKSQTRVRLQV